MGAWFQNLICVPLIIAYLAQIIFEPMESLQVADLSEEMQQWRNSGKIISVGPYEIFYKKLEFNGEKRDNGDIPSIVIVHGFPSSSFDYHKVDLEELRKFGDVILFDHLGFGFSSKPEKDFTFSIFELADYTEMFLEQLEIENVVLIGHDMGDTVVCELIKRRDRGILGVEIHGAAFSNGGMDFKYAKLRLVQWLLRQPFGFGKGVNRLGAILGKKYPIILDRSYHEIWGKNHNIQERNSDIQDLNAMNRLNAGHLLLYKTIYYLYDRDNFEYSWHQALSKVNFPVFIIWGNDDAVAPAEIGTSISSIAKNSVLRTKEGVGHFTMLEDPEFWTENIIDFLKRIK